MRTDKPRSRHLVIGALAGLVLGVGATCWSFADHSPFGIRSSFPSTFYGRVVKPEDLHPVTKDSYFRGYAKEDYIIRVLDGKIENTEPLTMEPQERYRYLQF